MKTIKISYGDLPKYSRTPIFSYCRKLIKKGEDPSTRLEVYRQFDEPAVIIKAIGEGAKWTVLETEEEGPYFKLYREPLFKQAA